MNEPTETGVATVGMNRESIDLLKTTICKGSTDDELKLFVQVCQRTGLDPFARQIFAVRRFVKKTQREEMQIQTSIDGFRLIAERSHNYAGQLGPFWTADGEKWTDVWLAKSHPAAAKVGILRRGFKEPLWAVAVWDEFCPLYDGKPMGLWRSMGTVMLAKCAESQGLRRAFPQDLSGIYTEEEMAQADPKADAQDVEPKTIEWTDEEITSAKAMLPELGEKLMELGLPEPDVKSILADPESTIGLPDVSFNTWTNRFLGYRDRKLAKYEKAS